MATVTGLTIEDFEQLPDALAHNHELIDGELVDVAGNTADHNSLRDAFIELLRPFVRERGLGRVFAEQEYEFGENAHGPDVSFLGPSKAKMLDGNLRVQRFVPDLAIEIASKNDKFDALFAKALRYWRHGTKEVWIFSIQTRLAFLCSQQPPVVLDETQEFRPAQIPGFSIRIADLFKMI
jgi:Uma2 family endonuclease